MGFVFTPKETQMPTTLQIVTVTETLPNGQTIETTMITNLGALVFALLAPVNNA